MDKRFSRHRRGRTPSNDANPIHEKATPMNETDLFVDELWLQRKRGALFKDLTHQRFGRWFVLTALEQSRWLCLCDCNNLRSVLTHTLMSGTSQSCGCLQIESVKALRKRPAACSQKTYRAHYSLLQRCLNPECPAYPGYGGRNPPVTVCQRWQESLDNFFEDMGEPPTEFHSIDRIDNALGYCKENCRWATRLEQERNKTVTIFITAFGDRRCMSEWSELCGLAAGTISRRLSVGVSPEDALTMPSKSPRCKMHLKPNWLQEYVAKRN